MSVKANTKAWRDFAKQLSDHGAGPMRQVEKDLDALINKRSRDIAKTINEVHRELLSDGTDLWMRKFSSKIPEEEKKVLRKIGKYSDFNCRVQQRKGNLLFTSTASFMGGDYYTGRKHKSLNKWVKKHNVSIDPDQYMFDLFIEKGIVDQLPEVWTRENDSPYIRGWKKYSEYKQNPYRNPYFDSSKNFEPKETLRAALLGGNENRRGEKDGGYYRRQGTQLFKRYFGGDK